MSPKILVADKYPLAKSGVSLIITGLYPGANVSLANNSNTFYSTLLQTRHNVAMRSVPVPYIPDF